MPKLGRVRAHIELSDEQQVSDAIRSHQQQVSDAIKSHQQQRAWYVHTSSSGMMPAAGTRISEHALSNVRSAAPTSSGVLPN